MATGLLSMMLWALVFAAMMEFGLAGRVKKDRMKFIECTAGCKLKYSGDVELFEINRSTRGI